MEYQTHPTATQMSALLATRMQQRLRFKHLALIRALADCGTLHLAAEELNMTQPAATKLLKDLESTLGVKLFGRHPRGMEVTALGESVVAYARLILGQMTHLTSDLESKRLGGHGVLSVGLIMGSAPDLVGPATAAMKARYPRLTIRLLGDNSDQIMAMLEAHQIELAVCRCITTEQHAQFRFETLGNEDLLLVGSQEHPLSRLKKLRLADLMDETWILPPLPTPIRVLLEEALAHLDLPRPVKLIECNSVYATLQMLQCHRSVALLSEPVARSALAAGQITRLRANFDGKLTPYGLVSRRFSSLSVAAQEFARILKARAAGG